MGPWLGGEPPALATRSAHWNCAWVGAMKRAERNTTRGIKLRVENDPGSKLFFIISRLQAFIFGSFLGNPHSRFILDSLKAPWRGSLFPAAPPSRGGHRPPPHTEESAGQGCRESRGEWSGFPEQFA